MMVHITGYEVFSIGEEGSMEAGAFTEIEDEPDVHFCISYMYVLCVYWVWVE